MYEQVIKFANAGLAAIATEEEGNALTQDLMNTQDKRLQQVRRGKKQKQLKDAEHYERYGSETEALASLAKQGLVLPPPGSPGMDCEGKWIAELRKVKPKRLGKTKNYTHRINISAKKGTRSWLKPFEIKPNEPGRYYIPADQVPHFNQVHVIEITVEKIR